MGSAFRIVILLAGILVGIGLIYAQPVDPWVRKAMLETADRMGVLAQQPNRVSGWPPKVGSKFPQIELVDHTGARFNLANLAGKPTLVEIVAMSCAGCQAYSGGNRFGGYGGFPAQADMQSIDEYFTRFTGGLKLDSNKLNFVQIIIYNLRLEPAEPKQLEAWRQHFHFDKQINAHVLSGGAALANKDSFNMIPGFLLLDKDQVVRYDATGHTPRHNLYTELLPAVRKMIE